MSFSIGYSFTDKQLEKAMEHYDHESLKELKKKARKDIDQFFNQEVLEK